ncbi:helix-turn-helix domain-containing protein [Streptomyces sp. NPDC001552]|uniref:helix-turn-helix domain-containing protein n=1 Tax=Streptomyces sp. NPDC001552 TaxID=3364587 RepID=UPI0036B35170
MTEPEPQRQSVRNAWINRVREEALRMRRVEVARCVHVGVMIATYADADGGGAFPSGETLACVTGCSEDTVSRCVKVLRAVGLLSRKRRPNRTAVYQLLMPVGPVQWLVHLHLYTDNRQSRHRRALKEREAAERAAADSRKPSADGFRNPSPVGVPEPVPDGDSEPSGTRPRTGSEPVPGRVPEPVPGGGDQYIPTCGRDPDPDHEPFGPVPQPPVRAGAGARNDNGANSSEAAPGSGPVDEPAAAEPDLVHCRECGVRLIRGGTLCARHKAAADGAAPEPQAPVQGAFPVVVPSGPTTSSKAARAPVPWPREGVSAPTRICGCGRTYRAHQVSPCPDCVAARHIEQAGAG